MKKAIIIISVAALVLLLCVAGYFGLGFNKLNANIDMPEEYYIEYEVTSKDGVVTTVAKGKDKFGNCYYKNGKLETLYILVGNKYDVYEKTSEGWKYKNESVTEKFINDATSAFEEYAGKGREVGVALYKETESRVICNRDGKGYSMKIDLWLYGESYEMVIDSESGLCLAFSNVSEAGFGDAEISGFVCTEFKLSENDFSDIIK